MHSKFLKQLNNFSTESTPLIANELGRNLVKTENNNVRNEGHLLTSWWRLKKLKASVTFESSKCGWAHAFPNVFATNFIIVYTFSFRFPPTCSTFICAKYNPFVIPSMANKQTYSATFAKVNIRRKILDFLSTDCVREIEVLTIIIKRSWFLRAAWNLTTVSSLWFWVISED